MLFSESYGRFRRELCHRIATALFVPCGGCKKSPRTFNQGCYIFDRSTRNYCCTWGYFRSFFSVKFLLGNSIIPHLNIVESPLGYLDCFLNLSFDVISVICRLHNLRFPVKIPFYLVPLVVFLFRAHTFFFYLRTICRFSWNGTNVTHWRFHDDRNMNTSADVSKFKVLLVTC
jgi:hypothetical protein